ncbi:MAG: hypothetical protein ACTSRP_14510 [Candidatus Helarchaeota archaeon]
MSAIYAISPATTTSIHVSEVLIQPISGEEGVIKVGVLNRLFFWYIGINLIFNKGKT